MKKERDILAILAVLATIATGVNLIVLIDTDDITLSSLVGERLVTLKLHFHTPHVLYYMLGQEKGTIYAQASVDGNSAFSHLSVPRESYEELAKKIQELDKRYQIERGDRGKEAYDFLQLKPIVGL